jgi:predicted kinase
VAEGTGGVDVVILIGLQASGKTTFYRQRLAADHPHVSKDAFPNARNRQRRQMRLIHDALAAGRSVAVDNTNPSPEEWKPSSRPPVSTRRGSSVTGSHPT